MALGITLLALVLAALVGRAELSSKSAPASSLEVARWALAVGPPLGLLLACFCPRALPALRAWPAGRLSLLAGLVAGWIVLVPALRFDPYLPAIAIAAAAACPAALRGRAQTALGADGLVVWLLLWIPFDLRWYDQGPWLGGKGGYAAWSIGISLVAVLSFGGAGRCGGLGFAPPRDVGRGALLTLLGALLFAAAAIPLGIWSGFLTPRGSAALSLDAALLRGLGLFLTVALPEELFFRGVLDAGLRARWGGLPALLISSAAFGLMHWNNRSQPAQAAVYVGLAALAGLLYALAFRRGGLLVAAGVHALVDLVWQLFLRK